MKSNEPSEAIESEQVKTAIEEQACRLAVHR
jgi:hypothetical protein